MPVVTTADRTATGRTTTDHPLIRPGRPDDVPAVLAMLDSAIVWMNARGNTEQWGTVPYSRKQGGVERVRNYFTACRPFLAEAGGVPVGALVLDAGPSPRTPISPAGEPECYVRLLVSDRRHAGRGIGAALLAHAAAETRRAGLGLLRVDCWAGEEGRLVGFYERNGFTRTETFTVGSWPGQVLARRIAPE
jgi:GNAT superfamily N-acetyltransferase